ncbi:MAG: methyl-accepting chemotaxis protein, partial [Bacteroidetes bacterium]|nr:methyl-accepting chemotaxis protein [Bacteroidota bacterium]
MNFRSIGFRLIFGGCLAVLIPLVIVGYISTHKSSTALKTLTKENNSAIAKDMVALIDKILEEEKKLVTAFAAGQLVQSVAEKVEANGIAGVSEDIGKLRQEMKQKYKRLGSQYLGIFVTDSKGKIYTGELENGQEYNGADLSDKEYFKKAKNMGQPAISD